MNRPFDRLRISAPLRAVAYALPFLVVAGLLWRPAPEAAEAATVIPAPAIDQPASSGGLDTAVLAGGCFWGVQAVFQHVDGVTEAVSGYAGGAKAAPSYEEVSSGTTGHAEAVRVTFDPAKISYGRILQIYFSVAHDPTQLNRQGPDVGTQYRSEIFAADDAQKKVAEAYVAQLDGVKSYKRPIVTRIEPLKAFYPAEDYHQDYLIHHPDSPYIVFNDLPKLDHLKQLFPGVYRPVPVTTSLPPRA